MEAKEAEQLRLKLSSLSLDSAHQPPHNGDTEKDEEYHYDWLLGTGLFNNVVVVDNLPVVGADRLEKIELWVWRNCSKYGEIKKDGVSMPLNPQTQETLGYCFVDYNTRKEAENAQKNINGHKMDKGQTLSAYLYDEFDRITNTPDEGTRPEIAPYVAGENPQEWITVGKAWDQKVLSDTEASEEEEKD